MLARWLTLEHGEGLTEDGNIWRPVGEDKAVSEVAEIGWCLTLHWNARIG